MADTNYLRDSLRAASNDPPETCTLCGVLVNQYYQDAHNTVHQARYEPFAADGPGAAETCTLCGVLINQYDRDAHNRGHG